MAYLKLRFTVPQVGTDDVYIFYPDGIRLEPTSDGKGVSCGESGENYKALWLLHGAGGHSSDWLVNTGLDEYIAGKELIAICPYAGSSFYVNAYNGVQWGDVITGELWGKLHKELPISAEPEDNFVAGCSMGGFGAMLLGLAHPDRYGTIGSLSGGVEIPQKYVRDEIPFAGAWGFPDSFGPKENVLGGENDLYALAERRAHGGGSLPKIYMCCGTRDEHESETNPRFRDYLRGLGYSVKWSDGDYAHEWTFWDIELKKFIDFVT